MLVMFKTIPASSHPGPIWCEEEKAREKSNLLEIFRSPYEKSEISYALEKDPVRNTSNAEVIYPLGIKSTEFGTNSRQQR